MRIMALGDSHGNAPFVEHAFDFAADNDIDAIFQVGDFGIWDHVPGGVEFLDRVAAKAARLDIPLWFCDGNHENFDRLYSIPVDHDGLRRIRGDWVVHVPRGTIWQWDGMVFMAMGGAHSIDGPGGIWAQARGPGKGWWPEEVITNREVEYAKRGLELVKDMGGRIDVMFAHDAPEGVSIPGIKGYPAADANRNKLRRVFDAANPQLVVHGHYHKFYEGLLGDAMVVGLAADVNNGGQFMVIDTEGFKVEIPPKPEPKRKRPNKFNAPRIV